MSLALACRERHHAKAVVLPLGREFDVDGMRAPFGHSIAASRGTWNRRDEAAASRDKLCYQKLAGRLT